MQAIKPTCYDDRDSVSVRDALSPLNTPSLKVAPAELEGLLLHHPSIADAAVIGIPHDVGGEVPRAFVVLKPGVEVGSLESVEEDVKRFVDGQVNPVSKLRGGVEIIDAIPKASSGKILRRQLRDRFKAGH